MCIILAACMQYTSKTHQISKLNTSQEKTKRKSAEHDCTPKAKKKKIKLFVHTCNCY